MDQITRIPLSLLIESPTNPRKTFNESGLLELADSIRSQGVLQPIVVRPVTHSTGYEIVFGHRRFRAAEMAEVDDMPCIVRAMSDEAASIAQLHENLEREDVHPIEEADALVRLMRDHGVTVEQLMAQTGKSRTYLYNRLKLATLTPETRQACIDHEIGPEIATMIARVPAALQGKAVARCTNQNFGSDVVQVVSYREAKIRIAAGFTRRLAEAPFNPDAYYGGTDGPCGPCKKCTDNDPGLEELGAYVCTDVECYDTRTRAHWAEQLASARRRSVLLEGDDQTRPTHRLEGSGWVKAAGKYVGFASMLEDAKAHGIEAPPVYVYADRDGEPVECLKIADAAALVARLWPEDPAPASPTTERAITAGQYAHPRHTPEQSALIDNSKAIKRAIVRRMAATQRTAEDLRLVLWREISLTGELAELAEDLLGWPAKLAALADAGISTHDARRQLLAGLTADEMALALMACAVDELDCSTFSSDETLQMTAATAARYGIDPANPDADVSTEPTRDPRVPDIFEEPAAEAAA